MPALKTIFPSDQLSALRSALEASAALQPFIKDAVRCFFVIDASVVQGELRWCLGSRRNPQARSGLRECLDSGVFTAVAPQYLKSEIEEHLQEIAEEEGVTLEQARHEWACFERLIRFYRVASSKLPPLDIADPKDFPYKLVSDELGLPIYSKDPHFSRMNVPLISVCLDLTARNYARAASVTTGVTIGSSIGIVFSLKAVAAFCRVTASLVKLFTRLPRCAQVAVGMFLAGVLMHPKSRAKLFSSIRTLAQYLGQLQPEMASGIANLVQEFVAALVEEGETRTQLEAAIPVLRKRTALMHLRTILLTSKKPVSIAELETEVRANGYISHAKDFQKYLKSVLRRNAQFLEVAPGMWSLKTQ